MSLTKARVGDVGLPIRIRVVDVKLTGKTVALRLTRPDGSNPSDMTCTLDANGTEVLTASAAGTFTVAGDHTADLIVSGGGVTLKIGAGTIEVAA